MGGLLNSLVSVAESMRTTNKSIDLASNNVTNAKTPGYVKQRLDLLARRFELESGLTGGVEAGKILSSRKAFLEQGVQEQSHRYGQSSQQAANLERIEPVFDISQNAGIHGALNALFNSFSSWSVNPNDIPVRQTVIDRAKDLAQSFRFAVASLDTVKADAQTDLRSVVDSINRLGSQIRDYNAEVRTDARKLQDPGLEAQVYHAMEELAEFTDFDVIRSADGSFTVNLGGQTPITIGDHFYPISADLAGSGAVIRNAQGNDITGHFQQGKIKALLDSQNSFLPALRSDLDRLAWTVASQVNATLVAGLDRNGEVPTLDLFRYDTAVGAAATLAVNDIAPEQLAAASATAPGGNSNALDLAGLAQQRSLDDFTFSQFFGSIAGRVGRALGNARQDTETQSLLLSQARNLRAEETEVSLDEEAANLIAFQRQYQANAELVRVLNSLTETTINIIR